MVCILIAVRFSARCGYKPWENCLLRISTVIACFADTDAVRRQHSGACVRVNLWQRAAKRERNPGDSKSTQSLELVLERIFSNDIATADAGRHCYITHWMCFIPYVSVLGKRIRCCFMRMCILLEAFLLQLYDSQCCHQTNPLVSHLNYLVQLCPRRLLFSQSVLLQEPCYLHPDIWVNPVQLMLHSNCLRLVKAQRLRH